MKAFEIVLIVLFVSACFGENPTEIEKPKPELNMIWQIDTNIIDAPSAPPLIVDDSVLIITGELSLRAQRISDGKTKWKSEIDGKNALDTKVLLLQDDTIVSAHKNKILGWNKIKGRIILEIKEQDKVSVFPRGRNTVVDNGFAFIGDTLDAYVINASGKIRFRIDVDFGSLSSGYVNQKVYLGQTKTINGALTLGRIRAFDSQTGDSIWVYNTNNGGFNESILIKGGILFSGSFGNSPLNEVVALNAETGEVIWRYESDYIYTRAFALGPEHVYVNTGGSLAALNKQTGELEWRVEWLGTASTKPVYLGGYVYHTNYSELMVIDDKTGSVVHREPSPDGTAIWHLAASSDKIFAQTSRQLIAYQPWHLREE